ncbi:hypothetical protein Tco_1500727 [Tanacetum coccineum]
MDSQSYTEDVVAFYYIQGELVKTVNGEVQLQALVDGKKIIITESTVRRDLQLEDAKGVDCLPNSTIFEQLTLMGYGYYKIPPTHPHLLNITFNLKNSKPKKPKRKNTEVPQPSGSTEHVADEAVNEEMYASLVRAATTTSSLEAEQDSGVNTPRSDEDRLKIQELMELCTNLQQRVLDLENTKTVLAQEITSLKLRVKKPIRVSIKDDTPYPCPHSPKGPSRNKGQKPYPEDSNTRISRYGINIIFWKISNVVPTPRNPQYAVSNSWIRLEYDVSTSIRYGVSTSIRYGVSSFLSNTAYSSQQINMAYPLPLDTAYRSSGIEAEIFDFRAKFSHFFKTNPTDCLSLVSEYLEEEEAEAMAETMEQYMSKTRTDYGSGVARPKIEEKDSFELKGQFLKEL